MIMTIYKRAGAVLAKKPFVLWGISLLSALLDVVFSILFGTILGVGIAISILLSTAMTIIYLRGYRGEEVKCVQLFDCFRDWATIKRVLCGMAWMSLWIFLWALIPIVGVVFAIIRTYEYRFTPYILMFEPDVPVTEAIKVSRERTKGYKGKMFGADVLIYVFYFVVSLVLTLLGLIPYVGVIFLIVNTLLAIAFAIFSPLFMGLVQAAFYEEINSAAVCPNCGAKVSADAAFCSVCGGKLGE